MLSGLKCKYFNTADANFPAAIFSLLAAISAICALVSDEWIRISSDSHTDARNDNNISDSDNSFNEHVMSSVQAVHCERIGLRHFWRAAKFGSFVDVKGVSHTTYHFDGQVLVDCITPLVANLFYVLIAFCFVIAVNSTMACLLSIVSTQVGFLNWLKRNTVLEMSSMALSVLACIITLVAGILYSTDSFSDVEKTRNVTAGIGSVLIAASGVSAFFAAIAGLRRTYRIARQRRLENQRLLCARSLRSWREVGRRPEDTRPIIEFERYLDSFITPADDSWEPLP